MEISRWCKPPVLIVKKASAPEGRLEGSGGVSLVVLILERRVERQRFNRPLMLNGFDAIPFGFAQGLSLSNGRRPSGACAFALREPVACATG